MEIIDNFLDQKDFDVLQNVIMSDKMSWFYLDKPTIETEKEEGRFQFIHPFFTLYAKENSPFLEILTPIIEILDPVSLFRIKANLLTKTHNIIENLFHIDMQSNLTGEKLKQWTTSIFYVNTNNGYTKFEDDTKVKSVANRMVIFPANTKHAGTSCTDQKRRIVINFNYFSRY